MEDAVRLQIVTLNWDRILVEAGMAPSRSQARRMIAQGAFSLDGEKTLETSTTEPILAQGETPFVIRLGKVQKKIVIS